MSGSAVLRMVIEKIEKIQRRGSTVLALQVIVNAVLAVRMFLSALGEKGGGKYIFLICWSL